MTSHAILGRARPRFAAYLCAGTFATTASSPASAQPSGGRSEAVFELALSHQQEGKLATAWRDLDEARRLASKEGRADLEELARAHLAALAPRLSRLVVRVPPEARVRELEVLLDNAPVAPAAWETPTPIDPGVHTLEARARHRRSWTTQVATGGDGTTTEVSIPVLPDDADMTGASSTRRNVAIAVGAAGFVAFGIGLLYGVDALMKPDDDAQARTAAWAAGIGMGVGAVGIGVGTFLFVTSPRAPARAMRIAPRVGAGSGGLALSGVF